ncbi:PREDICTED: uncharacterized protein LOC109221342 [Nicotiana attenuata]|uniref:uncharacterized protein LOC109221342 n=1 Tax=Nicotiana attenuata TaxID=49451 RepID=UPI0009057BC7|nr:PREDICTED: uncharacterized protein LOC109221342 [Nicotiana attenuata]
MNKIPLELHMWWEDLGKSEQDKVNLHLGGLTGLLKIRPRGDIIKALVTFWDPAHNVLHFSDFELTPTLEEIAGYMGSTEGLRHKYLIAPRAVNSHKFMDLLKISKSLRYGHVGGFNNPESGVCSKGNRAKWDEHRRFAFMVAFLGLVMFPRKDGNIDLRVAGVVKVLITNAKSTLAPMIVSEIYRALTSCKVGADFFEGCNLLLQMWMIEHLCHRPQYMSYGSAEKSCIEEFNTRMSRFKLPEGFGDWVSRLRSITARQIEWTLGWLPVEEIVYMPATGPYFLLMGLRGIQPYAPYWVMRQLGRCQVMHPDEYLSVYAVEVSSDGQFHEETVRSIWNECQYLTATTRVRDLSRGEVSPAYLAWYRKKNTARAEPERPAKKPHIQEFVEASQEQWAWLAKENEYRATISRLEKQVKDLQSENSLQATADEGEKKKLAKENEALRAQIQKMKTAAENPARSTKDEKSIKNLR